MAQYSKVRKLKQCLKIYEQNMKIGELDSFDAPYSPIQLLLSLASLNTNTSKTLNSPLLLSPIRGKNIQRREKETQEEKEKVIPFKYNEEFEKEEEIESVIFHLFSISK